MTYLRVLVSDAFAWEVKRHNGFEFKVLFPTKADLTKMTRFNAEMKEGVMNLRKKRNILGMCCQWFGCGSRIYQRF